MFTLSEYNSRSAEDRSYFEPLLPEIIAHFIKLMEVYKASEEKDEFSAT